MILYKYISSDNLKYIFREDYYSIKFSPFGDFNDPFESHYSPLESYDSNSLLHLTMRHELNNRIACLCLSRTPLNVLMWSHYGDKHEGFVIGIDTEVAGFEDENDCIVTAMNGGMNYSAERSKSSVYVTHENIYDENILRKLLLNKSSHWAYENEVRVIKRTDSLGFEHECLVHKMINKGAIKELYIGMRNNKFKENISAIPYLEKLALSCDIELYRCDFKKSTWDLDREPYMYNNSSRGCMDLSDTFESLEKVIRAMDRNNI